MKHRNEAADCLTESVERAAQRIGISRATLYAAIKEGGIKVVRFGRSVRIPKAEVERIVRGAAAQ